MKNSTDGYLTALQQCKRNGLGTMKNLSRLSGVPINTLNYWHRNNPARFDTELAKAAVTKRSKADGIRSR